MGDRNDDRDDRKHRDRDRKRSRSRDRKKDKKEHKSKSRRHSRSEDRSPSPPPRRRERKSGFDQPPPGGIVPGMAPGFVVPGMTGLQAAALPAPAFSAPPGADPAALAGMMAAPSQQATRHARRVYVGGLPPTATEQNVATFFSNALAAIGGTTAGPGPGVVNVYINYEKKFAFVEFRTVEETSNAMALDGIMFEGVSVRVRRPNDYNPAAAANLGSSVPAANLNLAAIGLQPGGLQGGALVDAAERVFVGGLPYYLTDDQCKELLGSFGPIKSFDLVKDRDTGTSKGYGFVVYADPSVTDIACAGLNGMRMGERTLTVRRATESAAGGPGVPGYVAVGGGVSPGLAAPAMRIITMTEAVTPEELANDEEYADILEDMREECGKFGTVQQVLIPRPAAPGQPPPSGLGKVVVAFEEISAASSARNVLNGRKFGGRVVVCTFLSEEAFAAGQLD
ncbi:hypothetical protein WJX81_005606 [Elliptochloris bilobata]|uniref:Splicing factor U2af large subunit n=1 Tax=Elliptochloris bilobata TaxID=381761 RepID=A0AAW1RU61_9CHLO